MSWITDQRLYAINKSTSERIPPTDDDIEYVFRAFNSARGLEFIDVFRVLINVTAITPSKTVAERLVSDEAIWQQIISWLLLTPDPKIFSDVQALFLNIVHDVPLTHPRFVNFVTHNLYDLYKRANKFNEWTDFDSTYLIILLTIH
jgi:hypothetical protein